MSNAKVCRFYIQGNCNYGSECRFVHSDSHAYRSNDQYYDEYQPRNNRKVNQQYYYDQPSRGRNYKSNHDQSNYHPNNKNNGYNYNSNRDHNNRNNYNQRNNYYEDRYDNEYVNKNRHQSQEGYHQNDSSNENYRSRNTNFNGRSNYADENEFNQSNNRKTMDHFNHADKLYSSSNKRNDLNSGFNDKYKYEPDSSSQKQKQIEYYNAEIKAYQSQVTNLHQSRIWPFTCFHPVGHTYPIQSIGSLNWIEVSFEEIRCDYYGIKNVCADPKIIHKQAYEALLLKVNKQREDIISLTDHVLNDMIATFKNVEQSKTNPNYVNSIQADQNSYWDMSIRLLNTPKNNKAELENFSFVQNNEKTDSVEGQKILMQTEVYGKMDNIAFEEENFTDYIPIMPPPQKYCL